MRLAAFRPRITGVCLALGAIAAASLSLLCLPAAAGSNEDPSQVLIRLDEEWSRTAAMKDAGSVASFYADDAIVYPPNEPIAIGKAAATRVWETYFADPSFSISWKALHAGVARSGDLGFTSGSYQVNYNGPDGKLVTEMGKFLCNWRRTENGSWKAAHDMWNSDSK